MFTDTQVICQVLDQSWNPVSAKTRSQVRYKVWDHVLHQVSQLVFDQVRDQVRTAIWDKNVQE